MGGLAQLSERVLSMHEVDGSIPAFSIMHEVASFLLSLGLATEVSKLTHYGMV